MNIVVKKGLKLILTHLMSLALTLFLTFVLGWIVNKWGLAPFSVVAVLLYISLFYSDGWNWGRFEGKAYNDVKESPFRALKASIIPSIIPIAFLIATLVGYQHFMLGIIEKIWFFPFVGFFGQKDFLTVTDIILCGAVIPIVLTVAYFVGTKNFSVLEKIAFRKNKQREQQKRAEMNK